MDGISDFYTIRLCLKCYSQMDGISIFYMSDAIIGWWLLTEGISIFFMSAAFIACFIGKLGNTQTDKQTNSNFINIDCQNSIW